MDLNEFARLKEDIEKNKLVEPIMLYEGKILDGNNRYKACQELKFNLTEENFKTFEGTASKAIELVWSKNFCRRRLNKSQSAMAAIEYDEFSSALKEDAKERKKSNAPKKGKKGFQKTGNKTTNHNENKTDEILGKMTNTNRTYIAYARKIKKNHPDIAKKIVGGGTTIQKAKKEIYSMEQENKKGDVSTFFIGSEWATDNVPCQKIIKTLHEMTAENCHLYLNSKNQDLPNAFKLLSKADFDYISCLTWKTKSNGNKNGIQDNTQHLIIGCKGKKSFKANNINTWQDVGKKEIKDEVYRLIDKISDGKRVAFFSDKAPDGWKTVGASHFTNGKKNKATPKTEKSKKKVA